MATNRFLAACALNRGDELTWYKPRPDGTIWKCIWRNRCPDISFLALKMQTGVDDNSYTVFQEGGVAVVFTLQGAVLNYPKPATYEEATTTTFQVSQPLHTAVGSPETLPGG